jgi:hypothetical protein
MHADAGVCMIKHCRSEQKYMDSDGSRLQCDCQQNAGRLQTSGSRVLHTPAEEACSTASEAAELARLMALPAMLLGRRRRLPAMKGMPTMTSNDRAAQG